MLKRILFVGGDDRLVYMAKMFADGGYDVNITLSDEELCQNIGVNYVNVEKCDLDADLIVFGLPAVNPDLMINCKLCETRLKFESFISQVSSDTIIAGGRFSGYARDTAGEKGIKLIDYSTDEVFQIENAFYTAEGAVAAIVKNTNVSLGDISILITGYGRISRALSRFLQIMGSDVCIYARREEQRAWAKTRRLKTVSSVDVLSDFDVIVNTVPAEIINHTNLPGAAKCTLVVDLASRPGYVSQKLCDKLGKKLIFLPGLPGKCAPKSSGEAAGRAILRMYRLNKEGM